VAHVKMHFMFRFLKKLFVAKKWNAALAWQATGQSAGTAYWMHASPVHLVLQRDTFSLAGPVPLALTAQEVEALTNTLNHHFMADEMVFFWHEQQWFLRLNAHPNIETSAPDLAIHKDIAAFAPTGAGAMAWAAKSNEIQMLLFEHPVNQAREAARLPVINSIWCYGGGQLAESSQ
jgi:hypothetical protein